MIDILNEIGSFFVPVKSFVIYKDISDYHDLYVESFDIGANGQPLNPQPLTKQEAIAFAQSLASAKEMNTNFLRCEGLLPENLLSLDNSISGHAVWYTPPQKVNLHFKESLGIPSGAANIPALLWKAGRNHLYVFSIKGKKRPQADTRLFHAPFFNTADTGLVCMGSVNTDLPDDCDLRQFIECWQEFFFSSYFSHLTDSNPVSCNIVQLWQSLIGGETKFPEEVLTSANQTLKNILP